MPGNDNDSKSFILRVREVLMTDKVQKAQSAADQ
jgi:hypothetical protein